MAENNEQITPPPLPGKKVTAEGGGSSYSSTKEDRVYRPSRVYTPESKVFTSDRKKEDSQNTYGLSHIQQEPEKPVSQDNNESAITKENFSPVVEKIEVSPTTGSFTALPKPPVPPVRQSPAYKNQEPPSGEQVSVNGDPLAPNLTSYHREFDKSLNKPGGERNEPKIGKIAFFSTLSMILFSTIFSWVPPAGLDWFFALCAAPVSIVLAVVSFSMKERVSFGVFSILLGISAPAVPVVMFVIGLLSVSLR